jgi:hypothetical protein
MLIEPQKPRHHYRPALWGKNTILITSKCLLKLSFASHYSQCCEYTTPELSMTSWAWNLPCNFAARQSVAPTTQITTTSMQIRLPLPNSKQTKCKKTCTFCFPSHDGYCIHLFSHIWNHTSLQIKMSRPDVLLIHSKNQNFHTRIQIWHPTHDYGIMCRSQ